MTARAALIADEPATTPRPHDVWQHVVREADRNPNVAFLANAAMRQVVTLAQLGKECSLAWGICLDRRSPDELATAYIAAFRRLGGVIREVLS